MRGTLARLRRARLAPALFAAAALACAGPVDLVVAPGAEPASGRGEAAVAHADGVRLVTRAGAWVGEPGVRRHVTPIHVAPHHHRFLPHLGVAHGFPHDPFWYDHYYERWETVDLPTADMLMLALPEGMLDPGGNLEGYLYFEPLEPGHERVVFRADLVSAAGDSFAELRIPYRAEG